MKGVFLNSQDPFGVAVGGTLGHCMCTGLAVIGGRMIAQKISVRTGEIMFLLLLFFKSRFIRCIFTILNMNYTLIMSVGETGYFKTQWISFLKHLSTQMRTCVYTQIKNFNRTHQYWIIYKQLVGKSRIWQGPLLNDCKFLSILRNGK